MVKVLRSGERIKLTLLMVNGYTRMVSCSAIRSPKLRYCSTNAEEHLNHQCNKSKKLVNFCSHLHLRLHLTGWQLAEDRELNQGLEALL